MTLQVVVEPAHHCEEPKYPYFRQTEAHHHRREGCHVRRGPQQHGAAQRCLGEQPARCRRREARALARNKAAAATKASKNEAIISSPDFPSPHVGPGPVTPPPGPQAAEQAVLAPAALLPCHTSSGQDAQKFLHSKCREAGADTAEQAEPSYPPPHDPIPLLTAQEVHPPPPPPHDPIPLFTAQEVHPSPSS